MFCGLKWKHAAILAVMAACTSAASAGVSFTNLDGAASWVWVEAESYAAKSGTFSAGWIGNPSPDYSGWAVGGRNNGMLLSGSGTDAGSYFTNTFTIPTSMSTAYMYVHGLGAQYASLKVYAGTAASGTALATYTMYGTNIWKSTASLGSYDAGSSVSLTQAAVNNWQNTRIDGFFVASQAITTPTTAQNASYYWMQAPTFTNPVPTITGEAFTPTVTNAPVGANYWVNGVLQSGGFGVITESGLYNLVIKNSDGDLLAGASFNFEAIAVPEPLSVAMLSLGALVLLRRR